MFKIIKKLGLSNQRVIFSFFFSLCFILQAEANTGEKNHFPDSLEKGILLVIDRTNPIPILSSGLSKIWNFLNDIVFSDIPEMDINDLIQRIITRKEANKAEHAQLSFQLKTTLSNYEEAAVFFSTLAKMDPHSQEKVLQFIIEIQDPKIELSITEIVRLGKLAGGGVKWPSLNDPEETITLKDVVPDEGRTLASRFLGEMKSTNTKIHFILADTVIKDPSKEVRLMALDALVKLKLTDHSFFSELMKQIERESTSVKQREDFLMEAVLEVEHRAGTKEEKTSFQELRASYLYDRMKAGTKEEKTSSQEQLIRGKVVPRAVPPHAPIDNRVIDLLVATLPTSYLLSEKEVELFQKVLNNENHYLRRQAAYLLGRNGPFKKEIFFHLYKKNQEDPHPEVRFIAGLGTKSWLERAAKDPDPEAQLALQQVYQEQELIEVAKFNLYEQRLSSSNLDLRREAVEYFSHSSSPVPPTIEVFQKLLNIAISDPDTEIKIEAIKVLGQKLSNDTEGTKFFLPLSQIAEETRNIEVEIAAIEAIKVLGQKLSNDTEGTKLFLPLIQIVKGMRDIEIKIAAIKALGNILTENTTLIEIFQGLLDIAIYDPDTEIKIEAIKVLGQKKSSNDTEGTKLFLTLSQIAEETRNIEVKIAAIEALGNILTENPAIHAKLISHLSHTNIDVRIAALTSLGKLKLLSEEAVYQIAEFLKDEELKPSVIHALKQIEPELFTIISDSIQISDFNEAEENLGGEESPLSLPFIAVFGSLAYEDKENYNKILSSLAHPSPIVSFFAEKALEKIEIDNEKPHHHNTLIELVLMHQNPGVRKVANQYLNELDPIPQDLLRKIAASLVNKDPYLQFAAQQTLRGLKEEKRAEIQKQWEKDTMNPDLQLRANAESALATLHSISVKNEGGEPNSEACLKLIQRTATSKPL